MSGIQAPGDSIAIIGMSCRYAPDLDSPAKFWDFLAGGRSAVRAMPEKRWKAYASSSPQAAAIIRNTTLLGSYLDDIEAFDADFFGISPREADYIDPQQRFMLELAWEALVDAGIPPLSLRGTDAGVYVAANSNDYGRRLLEDIPRTGAYAVNGTTYYGIANRVSYFLDLHGPSMALDTACAGSLTALHVAVLGLRSGEIPLAIVGGLNIMATPALNVALEGSGALAPDGRSKAFDLDADGYGRGEGAGVVVLKRLSEALRDGDPVQAVVRGTGVFQDGHSDGMMAPNASAQQHMLRQTYARAGIDPSRVDYVEAHGTGTPTGDSKELEALAAVFGAGRGPSDPCLVGSVKPNIGHVEGGSGLAGVIKTVLSMRHQQLPPSLHNQPSAELSSAGFGLRLVTGATPWPAGGRPRFAGVSSYGVGGTVAHVILQEAPPAEPALEPHAQSTDQTTELFPLSAMSDTGLRAVAGTVADWLREHAAVSLADVQHTLAHRRSHLSHRAVVLAASRQQLIERLTSLAAGRTSSGVYTGRSTADEQDGVVWVFSGHGAQWDGMGQLLLERDAAFAEAIDGLAEVFRTELGWTPRSALQAAGPWDSAEIQSLTFAMQIGLAASWRSRGLVPAAVIGHSVGEIAAAVTAGSLDLDQAARFACRRAAALRRLEGAGGMVMASVPFERARQLLAEHTDVEAAISASPHSTVLSGSLDGIAEVTGRWRAAGIEMRPVDSRIAFHSKQVEAVQHEIVVAAGALVARPPEIPMYSTAMIDPRSPQARDGDYWVMNLRQPVRFTEAVDAALADGHRLFLEISSHPVVTHSIGELVDHRAVDGVLATGTLRRGQDEPLELLTGLAKLHCHGAWLDWPSRPDGALVDVPAVAWQHRPYWIFSDQEADTGLSGGGHDPQSHTLLGSRMTVSGAPSRQVWQTYLDLSTRPYLQSHELVGVEVTPAASIINSFMTVAAEDSPTPALTDIVLRTPLAVVPPRIVQITREGRSIALSTRIAAETSADGDEWITHTTAVIDTAHEPPAGRIDYQLIRARLTEGDAAKVGEMFERMGVGGYAFPWEFEELFRDDEEQLAILTIVPPPARRATSWAHVIDGALTISAVVVAPGDASVLWMSRGIDRVSFRGEPPARVIVHSKRSPRSPLDTVDVWVADENGELLCEVLGLRFAAVEHLGTAALPRELVHEVVWRPLQAAGSAELKQVVLIGDAELTEVLATQIEAAGIPSLRLAGEPASEDAAVELPADWLKRPGAVVVVPSLDRPDEPVDQAAERATWTLIRTVQRLVELGSEAGIGTVAPQRLWSLTRGVRAGHDERSLAHAPLWGAARIVAGEHPELWGGTIDLAEPGTGSAIGIGEQLLAILRRAAGSEDVISLTATGDTEVARLAQIERSSDARPLQCSPSGTVLITGGLGALGLEVARWLAGRGATRLLLAGRRGLPPRSEWPAVTDPQLRRQIDGVLELESLGVTVATVAVDVSDPEQLATALATDALGLPPVRGVVHAAGVVNDDLVDKVDLAGLRYVLAPKTSGTLALHRLFPPGQLDFFVLFSSCGQFARLTGQTSYAAANSFMDALATHRRATGDSKTVSLGWTSWRGTGMSEDIGSTMLEANARGLEAVSVSDAFRAWAFADRFDSAYQAILRVLPVPPGTPLLPMFRELSPTEELGSEAAGGSRFVLERTGLTEEEATRLVTDDVRTQVAAELNRDAEDVELKRPLVEMGVDSVMTVALRVRLQRRYGLDLPPTILWAKPTVAALSEHVLAHLSG